MDFVLGNPCLRQPLDNGGVGHSAALTHRLQPVRATALFERVDQRGHDPRTAGTERVTNSDGAAVYVGPLVTLAASAVNLVSSPSAALSNSGLDSTTISDDGLT